VSASGVQLTMTNGNGGTTTTTVGALPLTGGTMTGAIKRYYSTASTDPMLSLVSNNLDATALWMGHGTAVGNPSGNYYKIVYNGAGSSPNNLFKLIAAKSSTAEVVAMSVTEEGNVTFTNTVAASISGTAARATADSSGNTITSTYISGLSINGTTLTITKGGGATSTITLQDFDVKVNVKARGTTKAYILGTTTSPTSSN
jgi:hypothetical protein